MEENDQRTVSEWQTLAGLEEAVKILSDTVQKSYKVWRTDQTDYDRARAALALQKAGISVGDRINMGGKLIEVVDSLDDYGQPQGKRVMNGEVTELFITIQHWQLKTFAEEKERKSTPYIPPNGTENPN